MKLLPKIYRACSSWAGPKAILHSQCQEWLNFAPQSPEDFNGPEDACRLERTPQREVDSNRSYTQAGGQARKLGVIANEEKWSARFGLANDASSTSIS